MAKVRITFEISEEQLFRLGVAGATEGLRLTDNGKVIIPVDLGRGLKMHNPSPCGTWERIDD